MVADAVRSASRPECATESARAYCAAGVGSTSADALGTRRHVGAGH
jgi:hypothetical protein